MVGAAGGTCAAAASALLLHPGEGVLASVGFLAALLLLSLAAGVWAGLPQGQRRGEAAGVARAVRLRWLVAVAIFGGAALFLELAADGSVLPIESRRRGLAVLLLLGAPGYATGWLLAGLESRTRVFLDDGGVGPAALAGGAVGVLLATAVLIPRLDPQYIFVGAGLVLALTGWVDVQAAVPPPGERRVAMTDKVVLITGVGGRGQAGFALAEAFLRAGARVVITDVAPEVERHAADMAPAGQVTAVRADLTDPAEVDRLLSETQRLHGRLDVLVNAAGGLTVIKPLVETSAEEWHREINRNATTTFLVCRAALPMLRETRGAIINFAAPAGLRAVAGLGAYSAAKAAVVALTRALALEERERRVRVNAILPGMIDTEQNRRSVPDPDAVKWVTREEIARVALFLAGDGAAGINGETIHVLGAGLQ